MENVNKKRGRPSKIKDMDTPFAIRLRELGKNMTHQEIADGVGVSRQTIGQFMLGNTRPDIDTLCKLADFFGVSTDYLLCRTDIKSTDADLKGACEYTGLDENSIRTLAYMCKEDDDTSKKTSRRVLKAFLEESNFFYFLDRYAILYIRIRAFKKEILKKFIKDNYPNITEKEADEYGTYIFSYEINKTHSIFGDDDPYTAERKFEEFYKQAKEKYSIIDSDLNSDIDYEEYKLQRKVNASLSDTVTCYFEYEEYNKIKEYYSNAINKCSNENELKEYYINNRYVLLNILFEI